MLNSPEFFVIWHTHPTPTEISKKGGDRLTPDMLGAAPASGMVASRHLCWATRNLHFFICRLCFSVVDFFFWQALPLWWQRNSRVISSQLSSPREQRNHLLLNDFSNSCREISESWLGSLFTLNQSLRPMNKCSDWLGLGHVTWTDTQVNHMDWVAKGRRKQRKMGERVQGRQNGS